MGGPIAFRTAAAVSDRVGAVASFHGGGLVTTCRTVHIFSGEDKAQLLIAIAANDDMRSPNEKNVLKETFAKVNLPAEIEVYTGAAHGCVPDSGVYNEPQAEKAWSRLLAPIRKSARLKTESRTRHARPTAAEAIWSVRAVVSTAGGQPAPRVCSLHPLS